MPIVRLRQDQVNTQALQGSRTSVQATPSAFGADVGAGISQAGRGMESLAIKAKQDAERAAITAAQTELLKRENELTLEGKSKRGRDAVEYLDSAGNSWDESVSKIMDGLGSESQRSQFNLWQQQRRLGFDYRLDTHAAAEADAYDKEQTESFINLNLQQVAMDPADDVGFMNLTQSSINKAMERAAAEGAPPERQEELRRAMLSQFTMQRIAAHQAGENSDAMRQVAKDYSQWLTPADKEKVNEIIEQMDRTERIQSATDQIIADNNGVQTVGDYDAALRQAETQLEGEERDEAVSRINARYNRERTIARERENEAFSTAREQIVQGADIEAVDKYRLEMNNNQWSALRNIYQMQAAGRVPVTSPDLYQNLSMMAADPRQRDEWTQFDLLSMADRLAPKDLRYFQDLQIKAKTDPQAMDGLLTELQAFNAEALAAGFDTSPEAGKDDATRLAKLKVAVDQEVRRKREAGEPMGAREVAEVTRRMAAESVYNDDTFVGALTAEDIDLEDVPAPALNEVFGVLDLADPTAETRVADAKAAFALAERMGITPAEAAGRLVRDDLTEMAINMPVEERSQIIEALQANGLPVNENTVIDLMLQGRMERERLAREERQQKISNRATLEAERRMEVTRRAGEAEAQADATRQRVVSRQLQILESGLDSAQSEAERRRIQRAIDELSK